MSNKTWLAFSFSVPAKLQGFRVKIWRKLNALGAVQIKNAIYMLPARDHLREQLTWMAKETEDQGGEALILSGGELLNIPDEQIRAAFAHARDADFAAIENEFRELVDAVPALEREAAAKKLRRRFEAVRAIDYFPNGKGDALGRMFEEAETSGADASVLERLDKADYAGKIWVTRANPYIDRLASFWLVRRFIDPEAKIRLLALREPIPESADCVPFDMPRGFFTHTDGLITFEVIVQAFGLTRAVPARMRQALRAIDLDEFDTAPAEAHGIKQMLDGLVAAAPNDLVRIEQSLFLFDTLLSSYTRKP